MLEKRDGRSRHDRPPLNTATCMEVAVRAIKIITILEFRHIEEFKVWIGLIGRCHNPDDPYYAQYGGRGIKVCLRWLRSFDNFYKDMGKRPKQNWIALYDTSKKYSKSNCYWIAPADKNRKQARKLGVYRPLEPKAKKRAALTDRAEAGQ